MSNTTPMSLVTDHAEREALQRIARAIALRLPGTSPLHLISQEALTLTDSVTVALALRAEDGEILKFVAVAGERANELSGMWIPADSSLAETALRTGQPSLHGDASGISPVSGFVQSASTVAVPIQDEDGPLGALFAMRLDSEAPYTEEETALLGLLADHATLALKIERVDQKRREHERELTVLYDTARTTSSTLNVHEVLNSVVEAICGHLDHQAAVLFLLNDERTHLFIAADQGLTDEDREVQLAPDSPVTARVLETGEAVLFLDTEAEPDFENFLQNSRTRSAMIAPIRSRAESLGVIIVCSSQPNAYSRNDLQLLTAVASHAGTAISNAWLYEDATRRAEEASAMHEVSQQLNATLDLSEVCQIVTDSAMNLLKVDKFALMLIEHQRDRLVTRAIRGIDPKSFAWIEPRIGEGIAGWVFEWMSPTAVADVAADARNRSAPIDQAGAVSTICVPMAVGDEVIGVLLAMSSRRRLFTVAEMELLYTVANQAAVAIVNAQTYQEARSRSADMRRYLNRIARALGSSLEPHDAPQLLASLAMEVMKSDHCAIYRVEGDSLALKSSSGFRASAQPDTSVAIGDGLTGWVARRGQHLSIENVSEDPRSEAHGWIGREKPASYLALPLKIGRKTVGVVEIYTREARAFPDDEVKLLSQFVRRARIAERLG
jgi:GAF domain-containing protein